MLLIIDKIDGKALVQKIDAATLLQKIDAKTLAKVLSHIQAMLPTASEYSNEVTVRKEGLPPTTYHRT
jgi:hypothetical protein